MVENLVNTLFMFFYMDYRSSVLEHTRKKKEGCLNYPGGEKAEESLRSLWDTDEAKIRSIKLMVSIHQTWLID